MPLPIYYFLAVSAIYLLMSWAFYLPYRIGQLYFLPVAGMAISAYFGGYAAQTWGWPFPLVILAGAIIGAFVSFVPSLAIGDAPCFAVVIVGLTFIFLTKTVIENTDVLGGTVGMFDLPEVSNLLLIAYILVVLTGFLISRFERSGLGRAASTIFVDRDMAASSGVNIKRLGILLQTWSGAIGGISGVLYGFLLSSLFPDFFGFTMVGTVMCMLFVGGYTTMWGVVFSAPLLWGLPLLFPSSVASWRMVIYGLLLIGILLLKPEGIISRKEVYKFRGLFSSSKRITS